MPIVIGQTRPFDDDVPESDICTTIQTTPLSLKPRRTQIAADILVALKHNSKLLVLGETGRVVVAVDAWRA